MKDPHEFATSTMGEKLQVVCLTATPDDGINEGSERNLMNLMGYRLIRTDDKKDLEAPKAESFFEVNKPEDVMAEAYRWYESRAVLIYANGDLNKALNENFQVPRVT